MSTLRAKRHLVRFCLLAWWSRGDREVNRCYAHLYRQFARS